jgi:lysine 2,3-aminomutase
VEIYYLFHCEPVRGIAHFRTTIEKGLEIKKQLRELSSGRINPRYMISTQIGKVEIGVDGFIESKQGQELWIKTPYSLATMRQVKPDLQLPKKICRVGKDGQISIIYREGSNS